MGIIHLLSSQNFPKNNISYPLIRTLTCASISILVEDLSNCFDYFWRFQDFLIYLAKYLWSLLNSPYSISDRFFERAHTFQAKIYISLKKVLKINEKKRALPSFYFLGREMWLGDSWKLICIDLSRLFNSFHVGKFKNVYHNFKVF